MYRSALLHYLPISRLRVGLIQALGRSMKWREPWGVSIKQQPRFNPFGKAGLKDFLLWSLVLAAIMLLSSLGESAAVWAERAGRLWLAPALGGILAIILYTVRWLSPRKIDSGPNGIVVCKSDQMLLIPWGAIARYGFSSVTGSSALQITDCSGGTHSLLLPSDVSRGEIERELVENTGQRPNNSFKPNPLRGSA